MDITQIREKYPQYDVLSDAELASRVHKRYYSDLDFKDFSQRIGYETRSEPLAIPGQEPKQEPTPQPRSMAEIVLGAIGGNMYPQAPSTNVGEFQETGAVGDIARGVAERVPESAKAIGGSAMQAAGELRNIVPGLFGMNPVSGASPMAVGERQAAVDPLTVEGAAMYQQASKRMQQLREEVTEGDFKKEVAYDALSVITDMIPALGAGALAGNPAVTLAIMGGQATGGAYAPRREAGETPGKALGGSVYTGAVEVLTEKIPVGFMFAKGVPFVERVLKVTVGEGLQEGVSSALQSAYDKGTIEPNMTLGEAVAAAGYETLLGTIAGGVIGAGAGIPTREDKAAKALKEDVEGTYLPPKTPLEPQGEVSVTPERQKRRMLAQPESMKTDLPNVPRGAETPGLYRPEIKQTGITGHITEPVAETPETTYKPMALGDDIDLESIFYGAKEGPHLSTSDDAEKYFKGQMRLIAGLKEVEGLDTSMMNKFAEAVSKDKDAMQILTDISKVTRGDIPDAIRNSSLIDEDIGDIYMHLEEKWTNIAETVWRGMQQKKLIAPLRVIEPVAPAVPVQETPAQQAESEQALSRSEKAKTAYAKRKQVKPEDELKTVIAKMGGLSRSEAEAQGIDPASFNTRGFGVHRVFTKKGMTFDQAAEKLDEIGFDVKTGEGYDANKVLDIVSQSLSGTNVFSQQGGQEAEAERQYKEHQEDAEYMDDLADLSQDFTPEQVDLTDILGRSREILGDNETDSLLERVSIRGENLSDEEFKTILTEEVERQIDETTQRRTSGERGVEGSPKKEAAKKAFGRDIAPEEDLAKPKEVSKRVSHTDKSIVDHPQQASIDPNREVITVTHKVGRKKAGSIRFTLTDWLATEKGPSANPNWNRIELVRKKTAGMDDQPGGAAQADRIRDSIVSSIQGLLKKPGVIEKDLAGKVEGQAEVANPQIEKDLDKLEADTFQLNKPTGEVVPDEQKEKEDQGDLLDVNGGVIEFTTERTVKDFTWTRLKDKTIQARIEVEGAPSTYGEIEDKGREYSNSRYRTSDGETFPGLAAAKKHEVISANNRLRESGYLVEGDLLVGREESDKTTGGTQLYSFPGPLLDPAFYSGLVDFTDTRLFHELRFKAQDKFHYLDTTQKAAAESRGITELPEGEDAYLAELRYHGMAGAVIEDFQSDHVEPLIDAISQADLSLAEVESYLWARHAPEANAQLASINPQKPQRSFLGSTSNQNLSGMSNQESQQIINDFQSDGKLQALQAIGNRVDAITALRRKTLVQSGLETQYTIDEWEKVYSHYVPLHREGKHSQLPAKGRGFDTRHKEKRRTGSRKKAVNILAHVVAQYEATAIKAEKVKVSRAMLEFALNNPNPDLWEVDKVEYKAAFDKDGLVTYRADKGYVMADNILVVRVNGADHRITFNENSHTAMRIAYGMKNLGADDTGPILNALMKYTRWLALVNTGANPEFIISNFARDLQTAGYNLSDTEADALKWKIIKDVGKAWRGIRSFQKGGTHPWAVYFDEFRKAGGQTGWLSAYENIEDREKELVKLIQQMEDDSALMTVKRGMKGVLDFIEKENTAVENGIRLSAFVHARRAGISEAKSARIAKELTVNFNRKGAMGQVLNAMYLFYNASIQGSVRLIQAGTKSAKVRRLMGYTVVAAALLDIVNRAIGGDDDDGEPRYDKVPSYVKERYLVIMHPSGGGTYTKIPLPWGYNVFHVMGQAIGEAATKTNYKPSDSAAKVASAIIGSFNPVGSEASIAQLLSPTVTDPLIQWGENKDWAGRPLRPSGNPFDVDKPNSQKYWNSVREPTRWVTDQLNTLTGGDEIRPGAVDISPEAIDLMIDTFTGGAGRFIADTVATPIKAIKGEPVESYEIPLLRKVYGRNGVGTLTQEYYTNIDRIRMADKQFRHYAKDPKKAKEIRSEYRKELSLVGPMKVARKERLKVRKDIKEFQKRGASKEKIAGIRERELAIMRRFNKQFNYRMRKGK